MQACDSQPPPVDPHIRAVPWERRVVGFRPASPVLGISHQDAVPGATDEVLARGMGPRSDKRDGDPNRDPDPPMAVMPSDTSI
jgi:hypothetical protein